MNRSGTSRRVLWVETGEEFDSISAALKRFGLYKNAFLYAEESGRPVLPGVTLRSLDEPVNGCDRREPIEKWPFPPKTVVRMRGGGRRYYVIGYAQGAGPKCVKLMDADHGVTYARPEDLIKQMEVKNGSAVARHA